MNKEQFEELKKLLLDKGYRIYYQHSNNEDYIIGKGFHREDNKWEEDRCGYQILLSVYDYTIKDWPTLPKDMRDHVGIEIRVFVSRTINERFDFQLQWEDGTEISKIEETAESFYEWICARLPEPKTRD